MCGILLLLCVGYCCFYVWDIVTMCGMLTLYEGYCHYLWDIVVIICGILLLLCVGRCCYYVWDVVVTMCPEKNRKSIHLPHLTLHLPTPTHMTPTFISKGTPSNPLSPHEVQADRTLNIRTPHSLFHTHLAYPAPHSTIKYPPQTHPLIPTPPPSHRN